MIDELDDDDLMKLGPNDPAGYVTDKHGVRVFLDRYDEDDDEKLFEWWKKAGIGGL